MSNYGWWAEDDCSDELKPLQNAQDTTHDAQPVPAGFTQGYSILAEVAANMRCGFLLFNKQERITYANPSALRLLHLQQEHVIAAYGLDVRQHLLTLVAEPAVVEAELEYIWSHPEQEVATDVALLDATVRWLRIHSFPVRDEQGELLGRGLLLDDITLEHSAVEMRTETLALAAHELKTPLAIIKGCATTLLGGSARWDPAMQREMLQMIDTQSDRLYDVLNTLLDVWRLDAGAQTLHLSQVYLPEILTQIVAHWRKNAPLYSFVLHTAPEIAAITCDGVRLEQALHAIMRNAVTYSPAGKCITVQAEASDVEVRISIRDEGIGIAAEHLDRIFERFYRVTRAGEHSGSGLGLASARATIEAHGGHIWADSAGPNQGTTIYLTLPVTPLVAAAQPSAFQYPTNTHAVTPQVATRTSPLKQDRRVRVLLAESDPRLTRYLRANLEEQQYRVQTVNHGVQFLRQLDLEEPDIILLATRLADMSGVDLLQRLRDFSQVPVMMLCDECGEDERVQLLDQGCDDLVMKPFGMKELLARVRALLRRQPAAIDQSITQAIFTTGDLMIDYAQRLVMMQGRHVQLSRTEYKLLTVLAQNVGMVVTHELLLEKVWGPEYHRDIDFIWVYISRLRRKIDADSRHPKYILTVPNVGYKLAKL
jgi:DNA-binding response OmpR family regulator/signal transduction histidine kinase